MHPSGVYQLIRCTAIHLSLRPSPWHSSVIFLPVAAAILTLDLLSTSCSVLAAASATRGRGWPTHVWTYIPRRSTPRANRYGRRARRYQLVEATGAANAEKKIVEKISLSSDGKSRKNYMFFFYIWKLTHLIVKTTFKVPSRKCYLICNIKNVFATAKLEKHVSDWFDIW